MQEKSRRPSPLQRRVLIVLAALEERHPGTPVPTRLIERLLTDGGHGPVYGPNLRASCRRMEAAGWLRTLRAQNMQLAEQGATEVRVLPLVPHSQAEDADDRPVELDDRWHMACRGDYVIRLDGTTCLQQWNTAGQLTRLAGDPLEVAAWLQVQGITGLTEDIHLAVVSPEEALWALPAPARL